LDSQVSELRFSALVDEIKSDPDRSALLVDLLREDHPIYDQRGTPATIRMRGWVLLAFERLGLPEDALLFVLEELDNGRDPYLVAAAARSLRSYACPSPAMAAFLVRALANIQFHDDLVCLERYGGYAISRPDTESPDTTEPGTQVGGATAIDQLLMALRWLGPLARAAAPVMEAMLADNEKGGGALSRHQLRELQTIFESIRDSGLPPEAGPSHCCTLPTPIGAFREWLAGKGSNDVGPSDAEPDNARSDEQIVESIVFEDQDGERIKFNEFFCGRPSIVAFFYTRCTNPLKCSLTITKLARLQKLLADRCLHDQIRTAAITYDPEFDLAERLHGYGKSRGVRMDANNRLLRTAEGIEPLRKYFRLGVNFIQSLVNRHRVEVYILDAGGRIAASFERIQWDENEVLNRAAALLARGNPGTTVRNAGSGGNENGFGKNSNTVAVSPASAAPHQNTSAPRPAAGSTLRALPATLSILSVVTAFFPKCPVCWAAYLSVFGIAGLEQMPYSPWLLPLFACLMLINLGSLWLQQRSQGAGGFYLAATGAFLILVCGIGLELAYASIAGIILTLVGSAMGVLCSRYPASFQQSQVGQISSGS
jgi:protein SCO1/2